jgi:hypothetical protein
MKGLANHGLVRTGASASRTARPLAREMKYSEKEIDAIFTENLNLAKQALLNLPVASGEKITLRGLNGWVYEQTIQLCLVDELVQLSKEFPIKEQFKIEGRANADLLVGKAAIEIKAGGIFGEESEKYKKYKAILTERGFSYIYITKQETHEPYRKTMEEAFGEEFCFFLTEENSWNNFVNAVLSTNETA